MSKSLSARICLSLLGGLMVAMPAGAEDIRIPQSRDRAAEFVGFVQPAGLHLRPFVLPGVDQAEYKLLSFDEKTGARTLLVKLPAGWKQPVGYHSADVEMFVVEGGVHFGGKPMGRYTYAYYPSGVAHQLSTTGGATVIQFWGGKPDFTASAKSRKGAKTDQMIDGLLYHDVPTTTPGKLPKYRDEPVMENSPVHVKLLRLDPATGQKTWIATTPGGYPVMSGEGHVGRWATSKSWQEGYMLAGDMTIAECLSEGQVAGTYKADGYFFRPAGIASGGLSHYSDSFAVWLYRSGPGHWESYANRCVEPVESAGATGGAK